MRPCRGHTHSEIEHNGNSLQPLHLPTTSIENEAKYVRTKQTNYAWHNYIPSTRIYVILVLDW